MGKMCERDLKCIQGSIEMKKPYISVIITAYDRKRFLKEAVKSVMNQTLNQELYEIIIIKNFLTPFDKDWKEKGIKILFLEGGNVGSFLKLGIKTAKGKIIAFLDDDDIFFTCKLGTLYTFFKIHEEVVYYHNNSIAIDENGLQTDKMTIPKCENYLITDYQKKSTLYNFVLNKHYFNISSVAVRKNVLLRYKEYFSKVTSTDDFIAFVSVASKGILVCSPKVLTNYRIHDKNTSIGLDFKSFYKKHLEDKKMERIFKNILVRNGCKTALDILNSKCLRDKLNYYILTKKRIKYLNLFTYIKNYTFPFMVYCKKIDMFLFLALFSIINKEKARQILSRKQRIRR